MQYRGIVLMLISVMFFAGVNTCVKYLSDLPTHQIVFFRSVVQLSLSAAFVVHAGLPFFGNNKPWLITRGITGMLALFLFFYTLQRIPMASATTIQYLSPIFTLLFAIFISKERLKPIQWLYILIAFGGVIMIKGFDPRITFKLLGMGILSAMLLGVSYNSIMKCKYTDHPVTIVMYFHLMAFPVMGIWTFFDWTMPTGRDWILLFAIALMAQMGQVLMAKALHADEAGVIMPLKYVGSVVAILIGYTVFDERLDWLSFAGIVLVLIGVVLNAMVKPVRVASNSGA